jgi:hypothetical protein
LDQGAIVVVSEFSTDGRADLGAFSDLTSREATVVADDLEAAS